MRKIRYFIKLVREGPLLIKVMWIISFVTIFVVVGGIVFKWENTIIVILLNLLQIGLFFKVKRQFDKKRAELKKLFEEFTEEIEDIMTLLILDQEFKENIKNLIDFAQENPFTMDDLLDMYNGAIKGAGDTEGYYFVTSTGIKIVHCIEKQVAGDVRYFSVSVSNGAKLPNPILVMELMKELGFKNKLENCILDIEDHNRDNVSIKAVAVREMIKNG